MQRPSALSLLFPLIFACGGGTSGDAADDGAITATSDSGAGDTGDPIDEAEFVEEFATEVCAEYFACPCQDPGDATPFIADAAACEADVGANLEQLVADAAAAGLQYDAACAGRVHHELGQLECRWDLHLSVDLYNGWMVNPVPCRPFHGSAGVGEPCQTLGVLGDDCDVSSRCVDGTCQAYAATPINGEACETWQTSNPRTPLCEAGSFCVSNGGQLDGTCESIPAAGEDCLSSAQYGSPGVDAFLCARDHACDEATMTCQPGAAAGGACSVQYHQYGPARCESGALCTVSGTCAPEQQPYTTADECACPSGRCNCTNPGGCVCGTRTPACLARELVE